MRAGKAFLNMFPSRGFLLKSMGNALVEVIATCFNVGCLSTVRVLKGWSLMHRIRTGGHENPIW